MLRRRISLRRRFRVQSRTIARYDWADDRRSSPRPRGSAIRSSQASLWLPYRKRHDVGTFSQHILETTRGHFWQYPLLATYRPGYGATRPFIGGGLDLGGTSSFTRDSQFTSTTQIPGGTPVTTTSADHRKESSTLSTALYIIGGVDARVSYISIRP